MTTVISSSLSLLIAIEVNVNFKRNQPPPGFQMHELADPEDWQPALSLYLPLSLAERLQKAKERALQDLRTRRDAEQAAASTAANRRSPPAKSTIDVEAERAAVRAPKLESYGGSHYPVYDAYAPVDMLASSRAMADKRDQERIETIYKQLAAKGDSLRKIGWPDDIRPDMEALARRMPHFSAVTRFVQARLQAAGDRDLPPRIPPILLTGDPGLGKTHYCRALAEALRTTVRMQPYDNAETPSQLLGSDRHWGNTHYGILFELLALGTRANPIVVLDELDKARSPRSYADPLAPLHSILEPSTACALRDISLEFTLDASLVTFIATANVERRIPETLLSRFRVFHIRQPQGEEAIAVAHEVLCAVLRRFELDETATSRRLAIDLAHLSAREILKATEDALTRMLADGRRELGRRDIRLDDDAGPPAWLH